MKQLLFTLIFLGCDFGQLQAQSFINDTARHQVYVPAAVNDNDSDVRIYLQISYVNDSVYNLNWQFMNTILSGDIPMYGWYYMPPSDSILYLIRRYIDTVDYSPYFKKLHLK